MLEISAETLGFQHGTAHLVLRDVNDHAGRA